MYLWNKTHLKETGLGGGLCDGSLRPATDSSAELPVTQKMANLTVWANITHSLGTLQYGLG